MTLKELNNLKAPIIEVDNSLKKFNTMNLFPEKIAKANEVLRRAGLPKEMLISK